MAAVRQELRALRARRFGPERDFDRVLLRLSADQGFEAQLIADPERILDDFDLDDDERAVLQQYRFWRVYR